MRSLLAVPAFLILSGVAAAKPSPVSDLKLLENQTPTVARSARDTTSGSSGSARERDYFQAPQMNFDAGSFYCPLQSTVFGKTRLAQSCD